MPTFGLESPGFIRGEEVNRYTPLRKYRVGA